MYIHCSYGDDYGKGGSSSLAYDPPGYSSAGSGWGTSMSSSSGYSTSDNSFSKQSSFGSGSAWSSGTQ